MEKSQEASEIEKGTIVESPASLSEEEGEPIVTPKTWFVVSVRFKY